MPSDNPFVISLWNHAKPNTAGDGDLQFLREGSTEDVRSFWRFLSDLQPGHSKNLPNFFDLPLQVLGVEKGCKKKHEHHDPTTAAKAAQRLIQKIQQLSRPAETTISKHLEKTI